MGQTWLFELLKHASFTSLTPIYNIYERNDRERPDEKRTEEGLLIAAYHHFGTLYVKTRDFDPPDLVRVWIPLFSAVLYAVLHDERDETGLMTERCLDIHKLLQLSELSGIAPGSGNQVGHNLERRQREKQPGSFGQQSGIGEHDSKLTDPR